ncbi:uncharacterized protein LOC123988793 [Osmia bicornis bicornis]|uniref:uncharacterized protein LOC123988793 n=1 Tax=Osmia bicornis bicornis TaxID=1437191 RepID=UPI001EAEE0B9|nr:uncharacterized protein LOC123988793 [Osmia bicornis bicornis]
MGPVMRDPSVFCIAELKKILREKGLPTSGLKAELIQRLTEADPSGGWMRVRTSNVAEETVSDNASEYACDIEQMQREMELSKREKQLAERELELARQQIEFLKEMQRLNLGGGETGESARAPLVQKQPPPVNISAIADLLSCFERNSNTFVT